MKVAVYEPKKQRTLVLVGAVILGVRPFKPIGLFTAIWCSGKVEKEK